ncbi:molybdenum cofactor guanylyltransferase [Roseimicrobium gellanilyticum]|uniref:Molybdenum cofactor guanylyltransferase n=2 Tax=Roseimicrobium gellanilyticum TaxID=748857 RepID=A0A366H5I5_9BACT|nr:molybdenum cofactor guanylyltransferase [Roseimicrobium gellanilyticum]
MGRDKAWLDWGGSPLWSVQLEKLSSLKPARLLIACREEQNIQALGAEVLHDPPGNAGPLPPLLRCMEHVQMPLLALAVDMPEITPDLLCRMVAEGQPAKRGVIFRSEAYGYEPLAALYPVEVLPLLRTAVQAHDFRLQNFAQAAVDAGLMLVRHPSHLEEGQFKNVNTPDDLP